MAIDDQRLNATDVSELLYLAHTGEAGWSAEFGGPEGVARLAEALRQQALQDALDLLQVRTAAMLALLREHSLVEVAEMMGMTKQAIYKSRKDAKLNGRLLRLATQEEPW